MKDKVSNIISISGIPKTDSVDQVINKKSTFLVNLNVGIYCEARVLLTRS